MGIFSKLIQHTGAVKPTGLVQRLTFLLHNNLLHKGNVKTLTHKSEDIKIDDISNIKGSVQVRWTDTTTSDFPHIFLRDNCQCSTCFHPTSQQRLLDLVKLIDINIHSKDVRHDAGKDAVIVNWPDNHKSVYQGSWLRERKFPKSWDEATPFTLYDIRPRKWSSSYMAENLPYIDYEKLMSCDNTLIKYLENLLIYGLSIIKNAPTESGVLYELPKRISMKYLKFTHYGTVFTVKSKPSPNNLAYTSEALPLHVDLPFYSYQPEFQFLHCIEQSAGDNSGVSLLTDGFRAAEEIKNANPPLFDILTKVKFKFNDIGADSFGDFNMQFERPIIGLDSFGQVDSISYNNHVRSSFINAPSEEIPKIYKAYYALAESLHGDILKYKMSPGDILSFNNKRVLHGRKAFDATKTYRWLEGAYMDSDEVCSLYRVVRERTLNR